MSSLIGRRCGFGVVWGSNVERIAIICPITEQI